MNPAPPRSRPTPASLRISPKRIDVAFLPQLIQPGSLQGRTAVVADILRATTTIIQALANGCSQVLPQPSIEAARNAHAATPNSILGGERGGRVVDGFHQGNSPLEYTRPIVQEKSLILATTNGTVAMEHCREAKRVLIGALTNLDTVAQTIDNDENITIVCSGTDGHITSEDILFAGALVERLLAPHRNQPTNRRAAGGLRPENLDSTRSQSPDLQISTPSPDDPITDHARIALNHWQHTRQAVESGTPLAEFFRHARGGINLVKIGHDADIVFASQLNTVPVVPRLDIASWSIGLNS